MPVLLDDYAWFIAIAEEGSLTKAADRTGVPKSKLSRRLAALEQYLNCQLVVRTTRSLSLTEAGKLVLQQSQQPIEALQNIETLITDSFFKPKGRLNILFPLEFFNQVVSSVIADFAMAFPDIEVHCSHYAGAIPELSLQDDLVFVLHEDMLASSTWIAKTLISFPQSIYGKKDRVSGLGMSIDMLQQEQAILAIDNEKWIFRVNKHQQLVTPKLSVVLSSPEMRVAATRKGMGLTKLPDYIGQQQQDLAALALPLPVVAQQLSVLYQNRNIPAKTRAFLDHFQSNIGCLV